MKSYEFTAEILGNNLGGAGIRIPFNVVEEFGTKGRVPVKVSFEGVDYRGSIAPMHGGHMLVVKKEIRAKLGKEIGDSIDVVLQKDTEERKIEVPDDLQAALDENAKAKDVFESFAYTHRKEYVNWINSAKKEITRKSRIQKTVERVAEKITFS